MDAFPHLSREAAARGRAPGWRVALPGTTPRLFADSAHGSPGAALDAALAWRDAQLATPRARVPLPEAPVTLAPGVYLAPTRSRGRTYAVVRAIADDADGRRHTLVRSLLKHAPETALREAARHRARFGAVPDADALETDLLAAFRRAATG